MADHGYGDPFDIKEELLNGVADFDMEEAGAIGRLALSLKKECLDACPYDFMTSPKTVPGFARFRPSRPLTRWFSVNPVRTVTNSDYNFLLDSGASCHVVHHDALLTNRRDPPLGIVEITGADGSPMAVIGYGDIQMDDFKIPDVCLVQGLTVNLISVAQLARNHNVCCCFFGNGCNLMLSDGTMIGGAMLRDDNQYVLRFLEV